MAIPTFTSVSPGTAHTAGQMVTVSGANFRLPDEPAASNGPLPEPLPTVRVLVNGVACTTVRVYSATQLTCDTPSLDVGVYSIQILNLDNAGAPIAGETVTAASAITYARPNLTVASDLLRVKAELVRMLRRQFIENVSISTSIDFAEDDGAAVAFVKQTELPALALTFRSETNKTHLQDRKLRTNPTSSTFRTYYTFDVEDLYVKLIYIDNSEARTTNAQAALNAIFMRAKSLAVPRSAGSTDLVSYEMDVTQRFRPLTAPNTSNIKSFEGEIVIRGVEVQEMPGITGFAERERGFTAEDLALGGVDFDPAD